MNPTNNLIIFCREIQQHLDGRRELLWFHGGYGLCLNYERRCRFNGSPPDTEPVDILGECWHPFNASRDEYLIEKRNLKVYQNPKRLAFIKSWAEKELTK
jgi:hypothetical protein